MAAQGNSEVASRRHTPEQDLIDRLAATLTTSGTGPEADPVLGSSDVLVSQWRSQLAGSDVDTLMLALRVRRIGMLLDEMLTVDCESHGLKLNEMLLLMALRRIGEPYCLRPTDILKMHSVTSGTATYRIDQLTNQKLAERLPDPSDRRGYLIRLTPRGLKLVDSILTAQLDKFRDKLAPMSAVPQSLKVMEESLRLFERCIEQPSASPVAPAPAKKAGPARARRAEA